MANYKDISEKKEARLREILVSWIDSIPGKREEFQKQYDRSVEDYLDEYWGYEDIHANVALDFGAPKEIIKKLK